MSDRIDASMAEFPQIHVETAVIGYTLPCREFWRYLEQPVDAGYGKRIVFGSDRMAWAAAAASRHYP